MRVKGIKVKERAVELLAWSNSEGVGMTYERIAEIIRKETGSTTGYGSIASYMSRIKTGAAGYQVAGRLPRRRDASVVAPGAGNGRRRGAAAKAAAAGKKAAVKVKAKNGRRKGAAAKKAAVKAKAKNGRRKKTVAAKKKTAAKRVAAKRPVGRPKGSGKKVAVKRRVGRPKGSVKRRVGRPKGSGKKVAVKAKNGRRKGVVKRRVGRPKGSGRVVASAGVGAGVSRAEFRREIRGLRALLLENDRRKAAAFKELWRVWKG